jgi:phosphoribosylanthranilate isomerase
MSRVNGTRIKICGITNVEDMRAAVDYGADALGFVRVPGSPRYVDDAALMALAEPFPFVAKVILVRTPEEAAGIDTRFGTVQHYAEREGEQAWRREAWRYVRAFRIRDEASLVEMERYPYAEGISAYHLDAYHPEKLGGSGKTFDWELAIEAQRRLPDRRIILAGGLTPDNVGDAVRTVRPYAVDVSSGVEGAVPGRKDHARLRAFIAAVRDADRSV